MDLTHIVRTIGDPLTSPCEDTIALAMEDCDAVTYGQLRTDVRQAMGGLQSLGVKQGDRVALFLYNSIDYWRLYFAVTALGAIVVKLNWRLSAEEIEYALADSGATVVFVNTELADRVAFLDSRDDVVVCSSAEQFAIAGTGRISLGIREVLDHPPIDFRPSPWEDSTPAAIMYTSGTTGRPKGAVWSHGNAMGYASMQVLEWGFPPGTVSLTSGPFYHVGAFENLLLPTLLRRGTAVFMQSTGFSTERCAAVMATLAVTQALLYPFMINELVRTGAASTDQLGTLRMLVTGGSAIAPSTVRELHRLLPNVDLVQTYGLTEGGAISTVSEPADAFHEPESTGRAMAFTEVMCCSDDAGTPNSPGAVGEVWVRSPSVSIGYWGNPGATAETFVDGWCRTGDLGRVTARGRLQITGRKKDMIRTGGENVYPAELEMVLSDHEAVADIAIIGVPDARFDEAICAVVIPHDGATLTEDEFRAYARTRLAGYKVPKYLRVVDTMPRTASGKLQKFLLREQFRNVESQTGAAALASGNRE